MPEINQIHLGDCIAGMQSMTPESVDLVLTDPPFAIDFGPKKANYNRTEGNVLQGYEEITQENYLSFTHSWMKAAKATLKPNGSMFVFSGYNHLEDILATARKLELSTINHIIWKYQFGVVTKKKFTTSHYHVLFFCKKGQESLRKFYPNARYPTEIAPEPITAPILPGFEPQVYQPPTKSNSPRYEDMEDVWVIQREYWTGSKKTPTKLPYEILSKIISYTTDPKDLVLDPFMGSGQTAVTAKSMDRSFIGFELAQEHYDFAQERLQKNKYKI